MKTSSFDSLRGEENLRLGEKSASDFNEIFCLLAASLQVKLTQINYYKHDKQESLFSHENLRRLVQLSVPAETHSSEGKFRHVEDGREALGQALRRQCIFNIKIISI